MVYALAISPHTDDAELGCGGTLHKISKSQDVMILSLCVPSEQLGGEFRKSAELLGARSEVREFTRRRFSYQRQDILDNLIQIREEVDPSLIFCPSETDGHQDHVVVYKEVLRAFKYQYSIYTYETPWNQFRSEITAFSQLDESNINAKLEALSSYKSQTGKHYFQPDFTRSLAKVRGAQINSEYAEGFGVVRCFV